MEQVTNVTYNMNHMMEAYDKPVKKMKTLLGAFYEKEHSALSNLCGLIRERQPGKVVKVGGAGSSVTAAVLCCIDMLRLPCQLYIVDSCDTVPPYVRDVFDLKSELKRRNAENYHFFHEHTLAFYMDEIGHGVDLLILDAAEAMPYDVLDFIAALPYLKPDAIAAVCGSLPDSISKSILLQNVTADMLSSQLSVLADLQRRINFITTETISFFQVNSETKIHILDLFMSLHFPWRYAPALDDLLEHQAFIEAHYNSMCQDLYIQAVLKADPSKKMLDSMSQSLLKTFPQVLVYGKGKRGHYLLKLAGLLGLPVTGFVVSDGRNPQKTYKNLPVYSYSEIPFPSNDIFIFLTIDEEEVEQRLRTSPFHWMKLPNYFWDDLERKNYLSKMNLYIEKAMELEAENDSIWSKGVLDL